MGGILRDWRQDARQRQRGRRGSAPAASLVHPPPCRAGARSTGCRGCRRLQEVSQQQAGQQVKARAANGWERRHGSRSNHAMASRSDRASFSMASRPSACARPAQHTREREHPHVSEDGGNMLAALGCATPQPTHRRRRLSQRPHERAAANDALGAPGRNLLGLLRLGHAKTHRHLRQASVCGRAHPHQAPPRCLS